MCFFVSKKRRKEQPVRLQGSKLYYEGAVGRTDGYGFTPRDEVEKTGPPTQIGLIQSFQGRLKLLTAMISLAMVMPVQAASVIITAGSSNDASGVTTNPVGVNLVAIGNQAGNGTVGPHLVAIGNNAGNQANSQ